MTTLLTPTAESHDVGAKMIEQHVKDRQTMTAPDFKQALEVLKSHNTWRRGCDVTPMTAPKELGVAIDTAIAALQIADALMQEPTWAMTEAGALTRVDWMKPNDAMASIFKAMRDELLKKVL